MLGSRFGPAADNAAESTEPVRYPWDTTGDVIAFETPEQTRVEYRLAGFGVRIVAAALDLMLAGLVMLGLVFLAVLLIVLGGGTGSPDAALFAVAAGAAGLFLLWALLSARGELRDRGRTWGKRKLGIQVLSLTGRPPGVLEVLVRNLGRLFDMMPALWLVPTMGATRQRLGDLAAGTCVVVERPLASLTTPIQWPAPSWRELTERRFDLPAEVAERLRPADLDLVEYVLRRMQTGSMRRRMTLLRPIVSRYVRRLGLAPELAGRAEQDPRRFLGELGLQLRDRMGRQ